MSEGISICLSDREQLTEKQQMVFDSIIEYQRIHGFAPSIRDLCKMVSLASTSSVSDHLKKLEKKGYIERRSDSPRAIAVL